MNRTDREVDRPSKRRIAILLSGRGSNLEAIAAAIDSGDIPDTEIVAVISDVPSAPGLVLARERRLPIFAVDRRQFGSRAEHESKIRRILDITTPDLVCLAGYMRLLSSDFVASYPRRILNIHPALLPKFPGLDAQRRALESGETVSGCTVHFVDEGTDTGPVILRRSVPIRKDETVESLSARILDQEHLAYPEAIAQVLNEITSGG